MDEDTRLKHSTERFYVKNQSSKLLPTTNPINLNILNKQFTLGKLPTISFKNVHDLTYFQYCKNKREWCFPQNDWTFTFRNREFKLNNILEIFLREYLEDLFKGYEKYCNQEEMKEYLQKVEKIPKEN